MKNIIKIIIGILLLVFLAFLLQNIFKSQPEPELDSTKVHSIVEEYVRANITALSSEKAVLGGTFYVTKIDFDTTDGGVVEYEDGHIALRAQFVYTVDAYGGVSITSFTVLPDSPSPKDIKFSHKGYVVQPQGEVNWYLVYEEPGKPALRVRLVLNATSTPVTWQNGDRMSVVGVQNKNDVIVYSIMRTTD